MSVRRVALIVLLAAVPAAARILPEGIRPFRTYGTEAGLGNLAAMRLAQDSAGFLWVATQDGVYRYDGNRFARFGLSEGLPSSYVPNVQAAPDGSVWTITYGGLARFDGRRFNAVAAPQPNGISIDDGNNVWIATARGVLRGAAKKPFAKIDGWPDEEATAVWFDKPSHAAWAASVNHIGRFVNGAWTFWTNPGNERIDAIVVDRQHTIWIRSAAHLWSKGENEPAFHDESRALPATSTSGYLDVDRRGNLWVPTDRGVATHDDSGWSVIGAAEGLPIEWARDVLEDREGSIWIASLGVHRMLGRGELTTYDRRSGLPNAVIWSFLWDRAGRDFLATYFEPLGMVRFSIDGGAAMHIVDRLDARRGLSASKIFLIGEDARHRLWVGTGVGVDLVNGPLIEHLGMADGLVGDDVDAMAFLAQPNGEVFLGTSSGFSHSCRVPTRRAWSRRRCGSLHRPSARSTTSLHRSPRSRISNRI